MHVGLISEDVVNTVFVSKRMEEKKLVCSCIGMLLNNKNVKKNYEYTPANVTRSGSKAEVVFNGENNK